MLKFLSGPGDLVKTVVECVYVCVCVRYVLAFRASCFYKALWQNELLPFTLIDMIL